MVQEAAAGLVASFDRCWGDQGAQEDPEDPEICCQGVLVGREAFVVVQGVLVTAVTYTNVTRKHQSQHRQVADLGLSLMLHMIHLKENPGH